MTASTTSRGTRPSLLARASSRDPAAWSALVRLYAPLIAHWCRRCGLDAHDAADCTQDVFAAVAASLATFVPQRTPGAFRGWLWTITRHKVCDLVRRNGRQPRAAGSSTAGRNIAQIPDPVAIPDEEPSDAAQLTELTRRGLEQVRGEFAATTWEAFWRTVVDGVPTEIVAQQLRLTAAAVRQHRCRVMRRLRQQLGDVG